MTLLEIILSLSIVLLVIAFIYTFYDRKKVERKHHVASVDPKFGDAESLIERNELLSGQNANMALALDQANASVWRYDVATRHFYPVSGDIMPERGLSYDECSRILHPDSRGRYDEVFEQMASGLKNEDSAVFRFFNPDANLDMYCVSVMSAIKSADGAVTEIIGTQRNISNERETHRQIREKSRKMEELAMRYETLLKSINVGIEIRDLDGVLVDSNDANIELFGILDPVSYGQTRFNVADFPFFSADERDKVKRFEPFTTYVEYDFDKIKQAGYYETSKSGKITVEIKISPMYDTNGILTGFITMWSDVTENVLLNRKYEDLYRRQEIILSLLPVGVEIYDTEGWLVYQNRTGSKFFGADTAASRINAKNNPNLPREMLEKAISGQTASFMWEYNFDTIRDTNYFQTDRHGISYLEVSAAPITNENGDMMYYACVIQDQTDMVRAKKHVEQINRKLSMTIANSSIIPWDYDCQADRLVYEKQSPENSQRQSLTSYRSVIHPDYHERAKRAWDLMHERRDDSYSIDVKYSLGGVDEKWRYGLISGQPFEYDKDGKVLSYTGFIKDTTRWKTLTNELEELNKQNRLILDNTQSGFIYFTPDYRIQWENVSSTFAHAPVARKYHQGALCYKDVKGLNIPCEECPLTIAIERGVSTHREFPMGSGSHFDMLAVPIFNGRKLEGVSVRIDDITERKHINIELEKAKEKAEESNRLKSAFLANMSHEIRTPLNAIVGFSELILTAETDEEKAEFRKIISTNSQMLINLINDILDLSKIESGYLKLNDEKIDVNELFDEVRSSFMFRMKEGVELRAVTPLEYCMADGLDKHRVMQIMINFVSNAVKFTSQGSITMGYKPLDDGIRFYVSDTGIGIRDEHKDNVFKRFQKLDSFAQGAGLGLSICKAIAEAMGGCVGFESQSGQGTTFWAWLPCKIVGNKE